MPKKTELREGKEAVERFRALTEKVVSVPKSEIDKRAAEERAKPESGETETSSE
jgi:hypothetical protein